MIILYAHNIISYNIIANDILIYYYYNHMKIIPRIILS